MTDILQKIKWVPIETSQYFSEIMMKQLIFLHHTASSPDPYGAVSWWRHTSERVGTAFIIGGLSTSTSKWQDGDIIQVFSSNKWAYHLGLSKKHLIAGGPQSKSGKWLEQHSIGIELTNWGPVTELPSGKFKSYNGAVISADDIIEYQTPYREHKFYQKYTNMQIENLRLLLTYLCTKYNIPSNYVGNRLFSICPDALQGTPGIYGHCSVRPDKFDIHPQPELIQMLMSL